MCRCEISFLTKKGVWFGVLLGNCAIINIRLSLFTGSPNAGFIVSYIIVLLFMLYYSTVICGIRVFGLGYDVTVLFTVRQYHPKDTTHCYFDNTMGVTRLKAYSGLQLDENSDLCKENRINYLLILNTEIIRFATGWMVRVRNPCGPQRFCTTGTDSLSGE